MLFLPFAQTSFVTNGEQDFNTQTTKVWDEKNYSHGTKYDLYAAEPSFGEDFFLIVAWDLIHVT